MYIYIYIYIESEASRNVDFSYFTHLIKKLYRIKRLETNIYIYIYIYIVN